MGLKGFVKKKNPLLFIRIKILFCFVLLLLLGSKTYATSPIRVAFFVSYDDDGQFIQLVPGGKFYHVAIQIEGYWYHASPTNGVELVPSLIALSKEDLYLYEVLEYGGYRLSMSDVRPYLGLPFDYMYEWESEDKTDCTKFIAKLFNIPPTPSEFSGSHWSVDYGVKSGGLGVSPDELNQQLRVRGFKSLSPDETVDVLKKDSSSRTADVLSCKNLLMKTK